MTAKELEEEIKRKALAGQALTNPTAQSQAMYDSYTAPKVTTAPTTSNVEISSDILKEIQRKAQVGIPLTDYTAQKQELYNGYKNPAPDYIGYDAEKRPGYIGYTAKAAPTYNSKYQGNIDDVLGQLLNAPAFSYDANTDPLFAQYKESYNREGDRALTNAMAEASALSGGRGNSYAMTAGQQAQNYYNSQLNDKIPELQQLAYGMYNTDLGNKRSNIGVLQGLEDQQYGQFRGSMADYQDDRNFGYGQTQDQNNWNERTYDSDRAFGYGQTQDQNNYNWNKFDSTRAYDRGVIENDRNYDYNVWGQNNSNAINQRDFDYGKTRDAVGDSQWNQSFARGNFESDRGFNYNAGRDAIGDSRYDQEWKYNTGRDAIGDSRWQQEFNYGKEQDALKKSTTATSKTNGLSLSKYYDIGSNMLENTTDGLETEQRKAKALNWALSLGLSDEETAELINALGL